MAAWFVVVDGEGEEVVPVLVVGGGEEEEEGAEEETEDIDAVSLESCPDKVSRPVPNVNNGVWYSWLLCSIE